MKCSKNINYILKVLEKFRVYSILEKNPYRRRAYENAILQIKLLKKICVKDLHMLNLGDKMQKKIKEIIEKGYSSELKILDKNPKFQLFIFLNSISGIGQITALKWIEKYQLKNIADFKSKIKLKKIKLNPIQKLGLKYYNKINKPYSLRYHKKLINKINLILKSILEKTHTKFIPVGSYRRKTPIMNDIDILLLSKKNPIDKILNILKIKKILIEIYSIGSKKAIIYIKDPNNNIYRQMDLIWTTEKEYPFALLHTTGNAIFNINLSQYAKNKGLKLNIHGLFKIIDNTRIRGIKTEKDIFNKLGIKYIKPENRS